MMNGIASTGYSNLGTFASLFLAAVTSRRQNRIMPTLSVDTTEVVQEAASPMLNVDKTEIFATIHPDIHTIIITSNGEWTANVSKETAQWCNLCSESGNGNGKLTVMVDANASSIARTAVINIAMGNLSRTIVVKQGSTPLINN